MKKILAFIFLCFLCTDVFAAREYAKRFPTDTKLEVYTPNNRQPAGGSTGELQYNNAGVFGGIASAIYNSGTGTITFANIINFDNLADFDSDVNFDGPENYFTAASPYLLSMTGNSVLFLDSSKQISQDNGQFYYNASTDTLTVNTLDVFIPISVDDIPSNLKYTSFGITIDGGGSVITTGVKGFVTIPYAMSISSWDVLADQSGSCVVDVWKDTYANFPPTVADTITGSEKPTITAAQKNQDTSLTTWTATVAQNSVMGFNVDSCSTATRITIIVKGNKT